MSSGRKNSSKKVVSIGFVAGVLGGVLNLLNNSLGGQLTNSSMNNFMTIFICLMTIIVAQVFLKRKQLEIKFVNIFLTGWIAITMLILTTILLDFSATPYLSKNLSMSATPIGVGAVVSFITGLIVSYSVRKRKKEASDALDDIDF